MDILKNEMKNPKKKQKTTILSKINISMFKIYSKKLNCKSEKRANNLPMESKNIFVCEMNAFHVYKLTKPIHMFDVYQY